MNELRLDLDGGRSHFLPGDQVTGRALWRFDEAPESVVLRLFWHTSGKGTEDVVIVGERRFDAPGGIGEREFDVRLPLGPYSFSGTLISLAWSLELVALPVGATARVDILVGPTPIEVRLPDLNRAPMGSVMRFRPSTK